MLQRLEEIGFRIFNIVFLQILVTEFLEISTLIHTWYHLHKNEFVIISNALKTKISPEPQGAVYLDPEKPETAENSLYFTELDYEL